ncbi:MAG: hypothetical protein LBF65_01610 [Holosporales bacterium]|jgi:hypothetical protein|nr:hypothetical protein [Holosporales bacterium]
MIRIELLRGILVAFTLLVNASSSQEVLNESYESMYIAEQRDGSRSDVFHLINDIECLVGNPAKVGRGVFLLAPITLVPDWNSDNWRYNRLKLGITALRGPNSTVVHVRLFGSGWIPFTVAADAVTAISIPLYDGTNLVIEAHYKEKLGDKPIHGKTLVVAHLQRSNHNGIGIECLQRAETHADLVRWVNVLNGNHFLL